MADSFAYPVNIDFLSRPLRGFHSAKALLFDTWWQLLRRYVLPFLNAELIIKNYLAQVSIEFASLKQFPFPDSCRLPSTALKLVA